MTEEQRLEAARRLLNSANTVRNLADSAEAAAEQSRELGEDDLAFAALMLRESLLAYGKAVTDWAARELVSLLLFCAGLGLAGDVQRNGDRLLVRPAGVHFGLDVRADRLRAVALLDRHGLPSLTHPEYHSFGLDIYATHADI